MAEDISLEFPVYRLFRLDVDGHILGSEVLDAADDRDALSRAHNKVDGFGLELWDRARQIARIEPNKHGG
jgi:hypothetical protein